MLIELELGEKVLSQTVLAIPAWLVYKTQVQIFASDGHLASAWAAQIFRLISITDSRTVKLHAYYCLLSVSIRENVWGWGGGRGEEGRRRGGGGRGKGRGWRRKGEGGWRGWKMEGRG